MTSSTATRSALCLLAAACSVGLVGFLGLPPFLLLTRSTFGAGLLPAAMALTTCLLVLLFHLRSRSIARLPGRLVWVFAATQATTWVFVLGPLLDERPFSAPLFAVALTMAGALGLRTVLQPAWARQLNTLPDAGTGAFSVRGSFALTILVVALATASLLGAHTAARQRRAAKEQRLELLQAAVTAGTTPRQPPRSPTITLVKLNARGRITTQIPGLKGELIASRSAGQCLISGVPYHCVITRSGLAALQQDRPGTVPAPLILLMTLLLLAGLVLAWQTGATVTADLRRVADRLRSLARVEGRSTAAPALAQPLPGQPSEGQSLSSAVDQLEATFQEELAAHQAARQNVQAAEERKERFLDTINQELRTPLTTLCGHAQLFLEGSHDALTAGEQEDMRAIHTASLTLLARVNDIIDVAAIETGTLRLIPLDDVDLSLLCAECVTGVQAQARSTTLQLTTDLPKALLARVDPHRVRQIVDNLLSNAAKFAPGGQVCLSLRTDASGANALLEVQDDGVGIRQTELPHVFEVFEQVGDLDLKRQGSGLGLAIAKQLTELHGGAIAVESTPGAGTRFTVSLPVGGPP